jgi:hypothetical protein
MKTTIIILAALLVGAFASHALEWPEAKITFHVTDESGKSLANVPVETIVFDQSKPPATYKVVTSITDIQGLAVVNTPNISKEYSYAARNISGYYSSGGLYKFDTSTNGQWLPWNPTVEIKLRPILHPVPMYAKKTGNLVIPETGKSAGYDLMVGDWIAPYGKGFKSDLIFTLDRKPDKIVKTADYYKRDVKLFDATLTVSFSNPDDGIQAIPVNNEYIGSEFSIPRYAPEVGYESELVEHTYRESADKPIVTPFKEKLGYFYRIRTVIQDGKIVSAHYGKMSGINFDVINSPTAIINFTYYLNPEPNSRNMEFDPKQNLFKNMPPLERVSAP